METAVRYIAKKRLKIGTGYREIGEEVPEASSWTTLGAYISGGYVEEVKYIVDVEASETDDPAFTERGRELDGMKKDELKEIAHSLEVPVYGSKSDIIQRILDKEFD